MKALLAIISTYRWAPGTTRFVTSICSRLRRSATTIGVILSVCNGLLSAAPTRLPLEHIHGESFKSRANSPPRKVIVGMGLARFYTGTLAERSTMANRLIDEGVRQTGEKYPGQRLDLMVLPECAIREEGDTADKRAIALTNPVLGTLARKAGEHHLWVVVPTVLREAGTDGHFTNAAILIDRNGKIAGIYRKVHPVADKNGILEGGITPGTDYVVFECDFGKLGILLCWDMAYDEAWRALADAGAEIVALPSESPQTLVPASRALRHRVYVVTSTPRNNVSVFNPAGFTSAQMTTQGVLVHQIDLAYAILNWSPGLDEGRAFTRRYGESVGFMYASREDTGVFWSNDPNICVGDLIREQGFREMSESVERSRQLQNQKRLSVPTPNP